MRIDYKQLNFLDPRLREVMEYFELLFIGVTDEEPVITSQLRIGDRGVHGTLPLRAHDFSCSDKELGEKLADDINKAWEYDYKRPHKRVAMFHDVGQGPHIHLQVHPNTRPLL